MFPIIIVPSLSLSLIGLMQKATSAFPIGQYDAIGETVTTMLFPLILIHLVFFLGVLFWTLRDSLFLIGKRPV